MSNIGKPQTIDFVLLMMIALIWGSAMTAIKYVVDDMGAFWTASARVTIGFFAVLPFFFLKVQWPKSGKVWAIIAAVAALNMVLPFVLISWSLQHIGAGVGSLLLGTSPFTAMLLGHFFTADERITTFKVVAVVLAVSGIAILVGPGALRGIGDSAVLAQLAIILSGACYVSAGILMRRMDMNPIAFTTLALGIGTLMLIVVSFVFAGAPPSLPQGTGLVALIWLGVLPTGFAYVLRYFLVQRVGVSTFSLAMNTVPVFGIIIAAVLLSEAIETNTILALVLVLSGLAVARLDPRQAKKGNAKS